MKKFSVPEYSRREVNRAGYSYINPGSTQDEKESALIIINNWRTSHHFPLNTFQMRLRIAARRIQADSLVAQRIKRIASIEQKLIDTPSMNLCQMQDIGGCRAIMSDMSKVNELVYYYLHGSRGIKHKLLKVDDYIAHPKESGYRGVHLIYKYKSDKSNVYDNMRIEIQIRSAIQHAWATTVEIIGAFIGQALKSSKGEQDWLYFFSLMGSAMALTEGEQSVPNTPVGPDELRDELVALSRRLNVIGHLEAFQSSIAQLGSGLTGKGYYLLELNLKKRQTSIRYYAENELQYATRDYFYLEVAMKEENIDAVLVSADSIDSLKLAYPNYYADSSIFISHLKSFTKGINPSGQLNLFPAE